ncbi:Hypothetical_protein [Hexamita inflata]|uniref:Hypothetical_protein n=1 Tax=Hexamita inflata TaxID=28002 RepID=A0AA86Q0H6_9EUKA|nr:Hypothetical protein HINF_LOCUS36523 [Hexamita inflata]
MRIIIVYFNYPNITTWSNNPYNNPYNNSSNIRTHFKCNLLRTGKNQNLSRRGVSEVNQVNQRPGRLGEDLGGVPAREQVRQKLKLTVKHEQEQEIGAMMMVVFSTSQAATELQNMLMLK